MSSFVLDNSVTMRWCFDAGKHPYADGVLRQLEAINGLALVPVLWRYEVSSVLARAQLTGTLPVQRIENFVANLHGLNIVVDMPGIGHILSDARQLATTYRLTAYDASYLELAQRRNLPLATLDEDLRKASKAAGVAVL